MDVKTINSLIVESFPDYGEVFREDVLRCVLTAQAGNDWEAKVRELFPDLDDRFNVSNFVSVTIEKFSA